VGEQLNSQIIGTFTETVLSEVMFKRIFQTTDIDKNPLFKFIIVQIIQIHSKLFWYF